MSEIFTQFPIAERLQIFAGILVVIVVAKGSLQYFNAVAGERLQAVTMIHFRKLCYAQLMRMGMGYFNTHKKADFHTICYNYTESMAIIINTIVMIILKFIMLLFMIGMLLLLSWETTVLSVVLVGISSMFMKNLADKAKQSGEEKNRARKILNSSLLETLAGMKVIRVSTSENKVVNKLDKESIQFSETQVQMVKVKGAVLPILELIGTLCIALVIVFFSLIILDKKGLGLETLLVFLVVFNRMVAPAKELNKFRVDIKGDLPMYHEVFKFLEERDKEYLSQGNKVFSSFRQSIQFENVMFRYNLDEDYFIKGISFEIQKGMKVGIVGSSGTGKSTILELLLRFYDPQAGQIIIDGTPLTEFNVKSWRQKIGIVSQDIFLFNDTIRNNIAFENPEIAWDELVDASVRAHAHEFILKQPQGYDTLIGDLGVLLSGGQRQRISIARAILNKPDILLFDEATSALDSESERIVQVALEEIGQGKTVISIAHRLSTIFNADLILVMEAGCIVEKGSHRELIRQDKIYNNLLQIQGYLGHRALSPVT